MALLEFILHLDKYIDLIVQKFGPWAYLLLFLVIFLETGLVLTPFLPGDSLLFALGAFAAQGTFNLWILFFLLIFAAVLGDTINYSIGKYIGMKMFKKFKWLKKEHLQRTHKFYEIHGGKTIILARFIPIIRTFAPFVAGIGTMKYTKFLIYNVIGGIAWVSLFLFAGYYFGNLPVIKDNFIFVMLGIIIISFIPAIIEYLKYRSGKNQDK